MFHQRVQMKVLNSLKKIDCTVISVELNKFYRSCLSHGQSVLVEVEKSTVIEYSASENDRRVNHKDFSDQPLENEKNTVLVSDWTRAA